MEWLLKRLGMMQPPGGGTQPGGFGSLSGGPLGGVSGPVPNATTGNPMQMTPMSGIGPGSPAPSAPTGGAPGGPNPNIGPGAPAPDRAPNAPLNLLPNGNGQTGGGANGVGLWGGHNQNNIGTGNASNNAAMNNVISSLMAPKQLQPAQFNSILR